MKRLATLALIALVTLAVNQAPAQTVNLPNTQWVGSENLPGFGKLVFVFHAGGKATMIDAKATSQGVWKIENNKVVIGFNGGKTIYVGELFGNTLKGVAGSGPNTWEWQASLVNAPQPTPAPAPQPGPAPQPNVNPQPNDAKLSPANLSAFLRQQGLTPIMMTPEIGEPYCLLQISDQNWNYEVEVSVAPNGALCLVLRLEQVKDLPAAKLMQLLEANNAVAPCSFIYRAEDQRICLKLATNPDLFRSDLGFIQRKARESHSIWKTN
ncbi:MAG: hypothetical protein FJ303_09865 [Planctomycetes bacterium]|nr:hypothetical protein [Planctomycetota bacterium]